MELLNFFTAAIGQHIKTVFCEISNYLCSFTFTDWEFYLHTVKHSGLDSKFDLTDNHCFTHQVSLV